MCCFAVTQLQMLGKAIISNANKVEDTDIDEEMVRINWPEDFVDKAKIIRFKAQSMTGNVEAISDCFITGWFDLLSFWVFKKKYILLVFCKWFSKCVD